MARKKKRIENKGRCVYVTRELLPGIFDTEIRDRKEFTITHVHFDKKYSELSFSLEKGNGFNLPYAIIGESSVRQFLADVVGYTLDNPYPQHFLKFKNMVGKKVEVFLDRKYIEGVCPIFKARKRKFNRPKSNPNMEGNRAEDWKLEDIVGKDILEKDDNNN